MRIGLVLGQRVIERPKLLPRPFLTLLKFLLARNSRSSRNRGHMDDLNVLDEFREYMFRPLKTSQKTVVRPLERLSAAGTDS